MATIRCIQCSPSLGWITVCLSPASAVANINSHLMNAADGATPALEKRRERRGGYQHAVANVVWDTSCGVHHKGRHVSYLMLLLSWSPLLLCNV